MLHFIAQFRLQLIKVSPVSGIKFFTNIGKVHYIAIAEAFIGAVDSRKRLKQVMFTDNAPKVMFFKAFCIKAGKQHVIDKQ